MLLKIDNELLRASLTQELAWDLELLDMPLRNMDRAKKCRCKSPSCHRIVVESTINKSHVGQAYLK